MQLVSGQWVPLTIIYLLTYLLTCLWITYRKEHVKTTNNWPFCIFNGIQTSKLHWGLCTTMMRAIYDDGHSIITVIKSRPLVDVSKERSLFRSKQSHSMEVGNHHADEKNKRLHRLVSSLLKLCIHYVSIHVEAMLAKCSVLSTYDSLVWLVKE